MNFYFSTFLENIEYLQFPHFLPLGLSNQVMEISFLLLLPRLNDSRKLTD